MHEPYRTASDFSGCKQVDCSRAMSCLRYIGTKDRVPNEPRDCWILVEDPENCQDFIKVLSPEEKEAHLAKLSRFMPRVGYL
jgi:hypothetical protein